MLHLVQKALTIQNEGGQTAKVIQEGVLIESSKTKTVGGVLFGLIKSESGLSKEVLKQIFTKDNKSRRERKKMMKKMEELLLDV